ncbi:hypothetical protein AVL62_00005 [Serinicoccus chungangensis]|uniref:Uncharacterized protein n=1 Tax=Serinicoccus chungangensis TaxID=767452 RepID=A0A0W8I4W6_9MICO|nr:hypothetical protein [Serinicoccus chungangensis]KUG53244.1 hypothetical protein AVL62_00005 [Serinicoccus chungangensis]
MDTLRSFVVSGLGITDFWSKPDRLSESFELRRFTLKGTASRPPTDLYEFYWAHHFDAGDLRETLRWTLTLLLRRPFWRLDNTLRAWFCVLQILLMGLLALIVWQVIDQLHRGSVGDIWNSWKTWFASAIVLVQLVAGGFITKSLADAARYLTPQPPNIAARNEIRAEGLALIHKLHNEGKYQRVVVVGHSLGAVIGLDLIRLAWDELRHPNPAQWADQPEAKLFGKSVEALGVNPNDQRRSEFQKAQLRLWRENRAVGVPWLVTDFVTLGAPLAHASLLLSTKRVPLSRRQDEKEYPTCPPLADGKTSFVSDDVDIGGGQLRNLLTGHHGAPFGPTRWHNLYYPVRFPLFGDPVGGPVAGEFGPGVWDRQVRPSAAGWRARLYRTTLLSHTRYWACGPEIDDDQTRVERDRATGTHEAVRALQSAVGLGIKRGTPYPSPPPPR